MADNVPPPMQTVVRMLRRPVGNVVPGQDLVAQKEKSPSVESLKDGEVLLHRLFLSLDPAMRGWMRDVRSYLPPVKVGGVMYGGTVDEVIASKSPRFAVGDIVKGGFDQGWSEFAVVDAKVVGRLPQLPGTSQLPLSAHLGVLGGTGMTAYFGITDVGQIKAGETVVVSGAAGATGSVVCQIAKIQGCKVVGLAGGADKCAWLKEELGLDAVVDYKAAKDDAEEFQKLLRKALKDIDARGVDVYYDNVGGMILNEVLRRLNLKARIVICGGISGYNEENPKNMVAPSNYLGLIATRARMEGFLVMDYTKQFPQATADIVNWIDQGKMKFKEDVRQGLEKAPEYLLSLFNGDNRGKLVVKVGDRMTATPPSRL